MSDIPSSKNSLPLYGLIKFFSEEEHYLAFRNGSVLFRPPHYYRLCEEKGRSDRNESCLGYWDKELGDRIPHISINGHTMNHEDIQSLLIYPLNEQKDSWMQSWAAIGPYTGFEDSLERMIGEFGHYFVVLPASNIKIYAALLEKASNSVIRHGLIEYSDDPTKRSLIIKDSKLSYQKEYRFFVGECEKDETKEKFLKLQDVTNILYEANSIKFECPDGRILYFSQGQNKVTTVLPTN